MVERLYLTHFNRGEEFCPLCYASIIWRKVGERKDCPCDKLPVLCRFDKSSRMRVVKNGEILLGPFSESFWHSCIKVVMPPMPEPR